MPETRHRQSDLTDLAVTSVSVPSSLIRGASVNVVVSVRNVGNQNVESPFGVRLDDASGTSVVNIGTQIVNGLGPGSTVTLTFPWSTTAATPLGTHTLTATQSFGDENPANDQRSATTTVTAPSTGMHIGDLDAITTRGASSWSATVEIAAHDANHAPLNGVTVVGRWSRNGLNANTCTTGDLGGIGTCIVLFPSLPLGAAQVRFTVTSVTKSGFDVSAGGEPRCRWQQQRHGHHRTTPLGRYRERHARAHLARGRRIGVRHHDTLHRPHRA